MQDTVLSFVLATPEITGSGERLGMHLQFKLNIAPHA